MLLTYWTDKIPVAVVVIVCLVIYTFVHLLTYHLLPDTDCDYSGLNGLAVRYFGITEFYLSIFKIFLMVGLMFYTFITMVGGNPNHDAYGFRYWDNPVGDLTLKPSHC